MEYAVKTILSLLVVAITSLSFAAMADWPPVATSQPNQNPQAPAQVYVAPAPAPVFDVSRLQGEWVSPCLGAVPEGWPIPNGAFTGEANVFRKLVYSFNGDQIDLRTDLFGDSLCNGGGPALVHGARHQPGFWRFNQINAWDHMAAQITIIYNYCAGDGCPPFQPNALYGGEVTLVKFIGNELFFGGVLPDGQPILKSQVPLYLKGTEPNGNLYQQN
jgi:hypothetical protein